MKKITALFLLSLCLWPYGAHAFFVKNLTGHDVFLTIAPRPGRTAVLAAVASQCLREFDPNTAAAAGGYLIHVGAVSHSNILFSQPKILTQRSYLVPEELTKTSVLIVKEEGREITFGIFEVEASDRQLCMISKASWINDQDGHEIVYATENHRERPNAK